MSIFAKDCPRCGETNAAYAVSCRCGFAFNSLDVVEEEEQDISVTIQEEELYLEYLRARADQAAETAKRAARAAADQPANKAAASQSHQAQAAAEQAKAELEQQRARMKVAMNVLVDDKPEQPASTSPARMQPGVTPPSPTSTPPKPATTPPAGARKQPAPAAAKPTATPPLVERKEPAPAPAKSPAPAAKGGETTLPPGTAKTPQDLNKYIQDPDNARATSAGNSAGEVTGQPVQSQMKMPTGHADTRPQTNVQGASTPAIASKIVSPAARAGVTQAVPTKTENPPTNKQPVASSTSTPARSTPPGQNDAGAAPQAAGAAGTLGEQTTQGDAVGAKAAAAAARAKQLAEALKAAQAERAARKKSGAPTPGPTHDEDGKTRQEEPATSDASAASAKTAPAPVRAPNPARPVAGAAIAKPVKGQQSRLNGHDKPNADINAIQIPGTEPAGKEPESNTAVPKQRVSAPATVAKQAGIAGTASAETKKINGASRPITDSKETVPVKPAPGVTVTETPTANPQEELEAALKALSLRAPEPPAPDPAKASAHAGGTPAASPDIANSPAPAAASTSALDELPSLEPTTPANQKDCPNCTAVLPMEAKRCRCGFRFPEVEETMPGLSLSDSDFAALDGDTSSGITHLS